MMAIWAFSPGKRLFLFLSAAFLLIGLLACRSSAPADEIVPLYQYQEFEEYDAGEVPLEESAESETDASVSPDDLAQEPLQEPLEEEAAPEPEPEVIESEEPSPELPVEGDRESIESLREAMEALREAMEALREELEALREASPPPAPEPPPEAPLPVPPAPVEIIPPAPEPSPPEPTPPPAASPEPPTPVQEPPPQPTPEPAPQPPATQPSPSIPEPPAPEPPAPEPSPLEPSPPEPETQAPEPPPVEPEPQIPELPPPIPPPEPPSFLGPAEPVNPLPVIEPVPEAALPELPSRAIPEIPGEEIAFSRIVRVTVGQALEIPFRGTGWVYLGELGNRRGINYESRRLDFQPGSRSGQETVEGQSFIFNVDRAGTYILRFYKQDFIQDYIINDYVQVIAGERDENTWRFGDRVIAEPRWPPIAETVTQAPVTETERPITPPVTQVIPPVTVTETAPAAIAPEETPSTTAPVTPPQPAPPVESPAEYVRRARAEFDAGRIESALGILDTMMQNYPGGTDEAWWLYGQLLEANSPSRDVRTAMEYYRRLVNEFPFSDLVEEGRRRIAYLERYYFNIR